MATALPLPVDVPDDRTAAWAAAEHASVPRACVDFVLALASGLHRYGLPSDRLESLMTSLCARLGLEARFFAAPTALFVSFGAPAELRTSMIRVNPGEIDLGRLAELDSLSRDVAQGRLSVTAGALALDRLLARRPPFGPLVNVVCWGIAAGAFARLFGGGATEVVVASLISASIGVMSELARFIPNLAGVLEPMAGLFASLTCVIAARHLDGLAVEATTVAGIIVLLPGLTLTTALTELATRNLISGTSRLLAAAITFLSLAFGVALGGRLGLLLAPGPAHWAVPEPASWTSVPALVAGLVALSVLFRARRRDVGWILAAGAVAYFGARLGGDYFGPQLGAFVGALALGCGSNLVARFLDRPALVTVVPGLMMLVPGSLGFRSLESLLANDVVTGIANAFSMVLVAVAIVAGLLLANAVVPSGREI